jgi:hypothetical protein
MSTHEPAGRRSGQEPLSERPEPGRAPRPQTDKSAFSPSAPEYSVEVALPRSPWLDFHVRSPLKAQSAPPGAPTGQRVPVHGTSKPEAERVVISVPMSLGRSAQRLWKLIDPGTDIVLAIAALLLIGLAWCVVLCWYLIWAVVLVPYRLITRTRPKAS